MVGRNRSAARRVFWLAPLAIGLALLAGCSFESDQLGGFRFDDNYHLRSGERLEGDQVWVGSRLMFDEGSAVNGSITMIGDEVIAGGLVSGDLTVIARDFTLDSAALDGNNLLHRTARRSARAQVAGEQREECADKRQGWNALSALVRSVGSRFRGAPGRGGRPRVLPGRYCGARHDRVPIQLAAHVVVGALGAVASAESAA